MTLIELAVVLALAGIVSAAIGTTLLRQQRFYRGASELLGARENVRDALEVLSTDLRGLSVADTVRLVTDSAVEFFANIGASVACVSGAGVEIGLPGSDGLRGNTLTALLTQPDTGDLALIYRYSNDADGVWERHRISGFASRPLGSSCPDSSGLSRGNSGSGFVLTLLAPPSDTIRAGSPIRFVRRGRYSLYAAGDSEWYLGYRRCDALGGSACGAVQPLSGPYRPFSSDRSRTGLLFQYFDANGDPITDPAAAMSLARIDLTARSDSRQRIATGSRDGMPGDSATLSIAVRNRPHDRQY
jgi:type II secretory pathway pseudopilin PulG